jgi:YD repeat-containing protein
MFGSELKLHTTGWFAGVSKYYLGSSSSADLIVEGIKMAWKKQIGRGEMAPTTVKGQFSRVTFLVMTTLAVMILWGVPAWSHQGYAVRLQKAVLAEDWATVAAIAREWRRSDTRAEAADWLLGYAGLSTDDYKLAMEGFAQLGDESTASQLLYLSETMVNQIPRSPIAHLLNGDALARVGRYQEALRSLDSAIQLDSESPLAHNVRGAVRALAGMTKGASSDFEKALALKPDFADARANLGVLRLQERKGPEAISDFEAAIANSPDFALAYNGLGVAHMLEADYDQAISRIEQARQRLPRGAWLRGNLAIAKRDRYRSALARQVTQLGTSTPRTDNRGTCMLFHFDQQDRLSHLTDVFGHTIRYSYDVQGRLSRIDYKEDKWCDYRYNPNNSLREVLTEDGRRMSYSYGPQDSWVAIQFPSGDILRFVHMPNSRQVSIQYPDNETVVYWFDQSNQPIHWRVLGIEGRFNYNPQGQLEYLSWSDGRACGLRYDEEGQLQALTDKTGNPIRRWEVALGAQQPGRVDVLTEPLGKTLMKWDATGRLGSITSDWGWRAVIKWDERANKPSSMVTDWGYVEFDDEGRPNDIFTLHGLRIPVQWNPQKQLTEVITPTFGTTQVRYSPERVSRYIGYPDGTSMGLSWDADGRLVEIHNSDGMRVHFYRSSSGQLSQLKTMDRTLSVQSLSVNIRDNGASAHWTYPLLPIHSSLIEQRHLGRFWSRVQSLIDLSSRLPPPSAMDVQRHEDRGKNGEYWIKDPYYAQFAGPLPDFSLDSHIKVHILTYGVISTSFASVFLDVLTDEPFSIILRNIPVVLRNLMLTRLGEIAPALAEQLNEASERMQKVAKFFGWVKSVISLLKNMDIEPNIKTAEYKSLTYTRYIEFQPAKISVREDVHTVIVPYVQEDYRLLIDVLGIEEAIAWRFIGQFVGDVVDDIGKSMRYQEKGDGWTFEKWRFDPDTLHTWPVVPVADNRFVSSHRDPSSDRSDIAKDSKGNDDEMKDEQVTSDDDENDPNDQGDGPPSPSPPPVSSPFYPGAPVNQGTEPFLTGIPIQIPRIPPISYHLPIYDRQRGALRTRRLRTPKVEAGGVLMGVEVVENQPADFSEMFGAKSPTDSAAIEQRHLYTPFLLFCGTSSE